MDIAVLSDIHGNYHAFTTCVEYALARGIKNFIFLGDYLGEMAYPQKTMEMLYELQEKYCCYFVRGNREDYWLNYRKNGERGWKDRDSTTGSLLYTYQNLTPKDMLFFESMPYKQEIMFEGLPEFTICHGSPNSATEKMLPGQEKTAIIMENEKNSLILCGHTHVQMELEHKGTLVLNPGAVGIPLECEGKKVQFMILHGEMGTWSYQFVSLPYDVEEAIADLHHAGLHEKAPYWCAVSEHLLRKGGVPHGDVLARAMTLCSEETGECQWPNVPEKYWERAVAEMIGDSSCK